MFKFTPRLKYQNNIILKKNKILTTNKKINFSDSFNNSNHIKNYSLNTKSFLSQKIIENDVNFFISKLYKNDEIDIDSSVINTMQKNGLIQFFSQKENVFDVLKYLYTYQRMRVGYNQQDNETIDMILDYLTHNFKGIDADTIYSCGIIHSCIKENNFDLIKILHKYNDYPYGYNNILDFAIRNGRKNIVDYFLEKNVEISECILLLPIKLSFTFGFSVELVERLGGMEFVKSLYGDEIDIDICESTPLSAFKLPNGFEIFSALFEKFKHNENSTKNLIQESIWLHDGRFLKLIIEKSKNINLNEILTKVIASGTVENIKFLLDLIDDVHYNDNIFMRTAIKTSHISAIKLLLDYTRFDNNSELKNKIDEDLNNGLSDIGVINNFLKNPIISKCLAVDNDKEKHILDMISDCKKE